MPEPGSVGPPLDTPLDTPVDAALGTVLDAALGAAAPRPQRSRDFQRPLDLDGWSAESRWGFDSRLECYWVELVPPGTREPWLRLGPEHLLTTVPALARALAAVLGSPPQSTYLALTA